MANCVIKLSSGYLRGLVKKTVLNYKEYFSFQGVPYAKPPVGLNRFKDPVPFGIWEGERDASKHGSVCPHVHEFRLNYVGYEDCLYLNVYTPRIPDEECKTATTSLPVMVYIHGGGFTFGSGNDEMHGPDYLIERDIVFVTINYRLGVFGFLSLGNSDVPGNAGLKDQNLALKWVRDNIKYFGGNPNNVTLFGESAGAASVHFHTLSPSSSGLFHRVILQSGSVLSPWAFYEHPLHRAFAFGDLLGKKTDDVNELVMFLRDQPAEVLAIRQFEILAPFERKRLTFPFVPCVEVSGTGKNFLTEHPDTMLKSKQFSEIPYIMGVTDKEGMIMLKADPNIISELNTISCDPQRIVPNDLCICYSTDDILKKLRTFYFNDVPLSSDTLSQYLDLIGDLDFLNGIMKTLKYLLMKPNVPVHLYLFTFEGQLGLLKDFIYNVNEIKDLPKGVCHADDLGYIFHNTLMSKQFQLDKDSKEKKIIDNVCTLWTNFAKYGDPSDEKYNIKWECFEIKSPRYLEINDTLKIVNSYIFPERTEFWQSLYASIKSKNE